MWMIAFLLILGTLLLLGELLIFTGTAVAGIMSVVSYGAASALSWHLYGWQGVGITLGIIIVISVVVAVVFLRKGMWKRLAQKRSIDSVSQTSPKDSVTVGSRGVTTTRLAPSGRIEIEGMSYEARCNDSFVDPQTDVEVVGFDNFTVLVKRLK